ncbi:MAG: ABC transporter permease [Candidatus Nanoarchaeia archaeon]
MIADLFILAVNGVRKRSLRSWLTIVGIFIGVAALVSLVSLGQGLQGAVNDQFLKLGANKIFISPGGFGPPGAFAGKLTDHDVSVVKRVKGVAVATPHTVAFVSLSFKSRVTSVQLMGINLVPKEKKVAFEASNVEITDGRELKSGDRKKAIVGYNLAHDTSLFGGKVVKVGDTIQIEGKNFEAIGINKKIGNPFDDRNVYIPMDDSAEIFGQKDKFDFIFVEVSEGAKPTVVADDIKKRMRRDRALEEGEENFGVQTFESISNSFNVIFSIVQAVIFGIASISLVVGAIGIMNTMYTAVLERTREIGVMKAVGAQNRDILFVFLFESGLLGLTGGLLGVAVGVGFTKLVEIVAGSILGSTLIRAVFPWYLIVGALLFSFVVGAGSGVFPAMRAAKLKPVDALRYA